MYRREQHWLEQQVQASSVVHGDYDRRDRVPQPRDASSDPDGPVARFLNAFPDDEVLRLRTLDLSAMAAAAAAEDNSSAMPVGRRRAGGAADAAALTGPHMLGEECASLVEFVQAQEALGRLRVAAVDASGAVMDRVAFLVLKHFVGRKASPALTTLRLQRSGLTPTQFADLLDGLESGAGGGSGSGSGGGGGGGGAAGADGVAGGRGAAAGGTGGARLETLDVSGCGESALPLRSLAEFVGRTQTLRTLVRPPTHHARLRPRVILCRNAHVVSENKQQ